MTVQPGASYTYTSNAVDAHFNYSPPTTIAVTTPPAGAVNPNSPAFRTMRTKLVEIVGINESKQLLAALPNGRNPFQKIFLDTMAMRLKRLP